MKFVVVIFYALLIVLKEGSTDSTDLDPTKVIFLHMLDGTWAALDETNGRLLWSFKIQNSPLITSSHSNSFRFQKFGNKTLLIPCLQSDLVFEHHPGSNELHPKSVQELELGEAREKIENREVFVTGIGLYSGRKLYHCNAFDSCRGENEKEPVIDVTSVKRTVCSVEKDDIEQIDWCYEVSEAVRLRTVCSACSKEEIQSKQKLDFQLSFEDHDETVYVTKKTLSQEESETSWKVEISSPVASAWSLRNGNFVKLETPASTDPQLHLLMIGNYNGLTYVHAGLSTVKVFDDYPNGVFKIHYVYKGPIKNDLRKFDINLVSSKTKVSLFGQYKAKFSVLNLIFYLLKICVFIVVVHMYCNFIEVFHFIYKTNNNSWIGLIIVIIYISLVSFLFYKETKINELPLAKKFEKLFKFSEDLNFKATKQRSRRASFL